MSSGHFTRILSSQEKQEVWSDVPALFSPASPWRASQVWMGGGTDRLFPVQMQKLNEVGRNLSLSLSPGKRPTPIVPNQSVHSLATPVTKEPHFLITSNQRSESLDSHWLFLSHVTIPDPITALQGKACTNWAKSESGSESILFEGQRPKVGRRKRYQG